MKLSVEKITPFIPALKNGEITQTQLAKDFGVAKMSLCKYMARHFGKQLLVRGGVKTPPGKMLDAVEASMQPRANIAKIAREFEVDYAALYKRVSSRKAKIKKVIESV
jgi:hypothetical protein